MTHQDRILALLQESNDTLCDACVRRGTDIESNPAAVNQAARQLETRGLTKRTRTICSGCGKVVKCNHVANLEVEPVAAGESAAESAATSPRPWCWEGNVQAAVVSWLTLEGWNILQAVDTATKEPGVDVVASQEEGEAQELWVSVKGFPLESKCKYTQARHWFGEAVFDVVRYRNENASVRLAIALPDGFVTYQGLAVKTGWLKQAMPFTIFWVGQDGTVRSE